MGLRYFPPMNSIPLGSGLAIDADGKLESARGGGSGSGNIDGGEPDTNYGGTEPIDGGGV